MPRRAILNTPSCRAGIAVITSAVAVRRETSVAAPRIAVVVHSVAVAHRVAATASIMQRGRPVPRGELHAYLQGRSTSLCGRSIGDDLISFDSLRWSARPLGLVTCKICFSRAR